MKPAYEQIRTFQTDAVHFEIRNEALLEPRLDAIRTIVDGVADINRPFQAETMRKLYCEKIVDKYVDQDYVDRQEM